MLTALALTAASPPVSREIREKAYRSNNAGVAALEQFHAGEAAEALRQALSLDPDLLLARVNLAIALLNVPDLPGAEREARAILAVKPDSRQALYVLGLAARGQNETDEAKAAFRKLLALDPTDVGANVNAGQLLMQEHSLPEAIAAFRTAIASEPYNATAVYNLGLALTRSGQPDEGQRTLDRFRALKDAGYATLIGQSYPEQGRYAETVASTGAEADLVDATTPAVHFVDASATALAAAPLLAGAGRVLLFDYDGDGALDLFGVSAAGEHLYHNDAGRFTDVTKKLGLNPSLGGSGAVAGDLDNDTRPDLLVLGKTGVRLYRNDAQKGFVDATAAAGLSAVGTAISAALADFDHDGDLDLLLGGTGSADRLLQNAGNATFKDVAIKAGIQAPARVLAAVPTDYDNGRDMDLLEAVETGRPRLYRNLRDGRFRDVASEVGLGQATRIRCVAAADVNKDGYTDFFFGADGGDLLAESDGRGHFSVSPVPWGSSGTSVAQFVDYDDDGLFDLVAFGPSGPRLMRNLGNRWADVTASAFGPVKLGPVAALAVADLDGDGDPDLLLRLASGELRYLRNDGGNKNGAVHVRLAGLVSNRGGVGAKVEMRAGSLHQKIETSSATPAAAPADVLFGLGGRGLADAVRVLWPAGILQTELAASSPASPTRAASFDVKELDRKPSSCPYLYAWNGQEFAFITDFMGGGEMGNLESPGVFDEPDPLEYVRLTDAQLRPRDGRYELRVTNELEEALFVDHLALVSITHPADVELYPNEGLTSPAKPTRFFAVRNVRVPLSAVDDRGRDVKDEIARMDRRAPNGFGLDPFRGYAADHSLILDLGPTQGPALLLLTGWTDYSWSSDNVAAQQAGLEMHPPALDVQDAQGGWVTAIEQVGFPVGRPQTVVVDLTNAFKASSRRVRIRTNMRIWWDQIRVGEIAEAPLESVTLEATEAWLRERGFSAAASPDGHEPYAYDYLRASQSSPWKTFPGRYTRAGDVRELLASTDDAFVTSRPGDEIALSFDGRSLKEPAPGFKRTFLLLADGFSKEMDINSATPDTLGPLPFHGMTHYPYTAPESFPMTEALRKLQDRYDTRVVKDAVPRFDVALRQ